jgi:hypothetical protein
MVLGTICIISDTGRTQLTPEAVTIEGVQHGFLVSAKIMQRFRNAENSPVDLSYLIPNNSKICFYDTTFRLRDEVIKPRLERSAAAQEIYDAATSEGHAAILSRSLGKGLVEFQLGNIPPDSFCEVEVDCAFVASSSGLDKLFFKFPLDVCTSSGSTQCVLHCLKGSFSFTLRNAVPSEVQAISTNVAGAFDAATCSYRIDKPVDVSALFVTTVLSRPITSRSLFAGRYLCGSVFLDKTDRMQTNNEFVFVVDCSGSMDGVRIRQGRECLDLFIRSLPEGCLFNIVRFGSQFQSLFPESVRYSNETAAQALALAADLRADLGNTDLLTPLRWLFEQPLKGEGVRQVFVLTDGEVHDTDAVIDCGRTNRGLNRIFTIGLGSGADAGLVERLADASGGRSDFVNTGEDLGMKVIPQLELSLQPAASDITIHVEGHDQLEITPWPIGIITPNVAFPFFVRATADVGEPILVSGSILTEQIECVIECEPCPPEIARCLRVLFAFETIQSLEHLIKRGGANVQTLKGRCVAESLESGVLCRETAFVGFTERRYRKNPKRHTSSGGCAEVDESPPPRREKREAKRHSKESGSVALSAITSRQAIDGSWGNVEELFDLAKCRVAEFTSLAGAEEAPAIFATIVAVAILRAKFQDKAPAWKMIEGKAIRWLSGRCADCEQLIEEAARQLSP